MSQASSMLADLTNPDYEMFSSEGEAPDWIKIFYNPMPEPIVTEALDQFSRAMWKVTPPENISFYPVGILENGDQVFTIGPWEIHLWLGYQKAQTKKMSCCLGPIQKEDVRTKFH